MYSLIAYLVNSDGYMLRVWSKNIGKLVLLGKWRISSQLYSYLRILALLIALKGVRLVDQLRRFLMPFFKIYKEADFRVLGNSRLARQ